MLMTFTFTLNPDTGETAFGGNIAPAMALEILTGMILQNAAAQAKGEQEVKDEPTNP